MDHVYWTTSLFPGEGWTVTRWMKHGTLFAQVLEHYERLTMRERDQVLEDDAWSYIEASISS